MHSYNLTQLATAQLVGGKQSRALSSCRVLLAQPPRKTDPQEKLNELRSNMQQNLRNSAAFNNAKAHLNNAFRTIDLKLAEYGLAQGTGSDRDMEAIRILVSVLLAMYVLYFIAPVTLKAWLLNHFALTPDNVGRLYPLLTSLLLHTELLSCLFSSLIIYSIAPVLLSYVGRKAFWQILIGSGVASNALFSMKESGSTPYGFMPSLSVQSGMSASSRALIAVSCLLTPNQMVQFFFFPVKALHIAYFVVGLDALQLLSVSGGRRADQVGGGLFGAAYWWFALNQRTMA